MIPHAGLGPDHRAISVYRRPAFLGPVNLNADLMHHLQNASIVEMEVMVEARPQCCPGFAKRRRRCQRVRIRFRADNRQCWGRFCRQFFLLQCFRPFTNITGRRRAGSCCCLFFSRLPPRPLLVRRASQPRLCDCRASGQPSTAEPETTCPRAPERAHLRTPRVAIPGGWDTFSTC